MVYATIYAYDKQSSPDWYSAALSVNPTGTWTGDLYATHGPWFGGGFAPAAVTKRRVGDLAVTFSEPNHGTLAYSVDGVAVSRPIERFTMRTANLSGTYMLWLNASVGACAGSPAETGPLGALATFGHTGATVNAQIEIVSADASVTCDFTGNYVQTGRLARSDGTYSCPGGIRGTYSMTDLETASDHMCGDFSMRNSANGCVLTSTFASVRF